MVCCSCYSVFWNTSIVLAVEYFTDAVFKAIEFWKIWKGFCEGFPVLLTIFIKIFPII